MSSVIGLMSGGRRLGVLDRLFFCSLVFVLSLGLISVVSPAAGAAKKKKDEGPRYFYGDFSAGIDAYPGNCDYNSETGEIVCTGDPEDEGLDVNYDSSLKMTLARPFGSPYDYVRSFSLLDDEWGFLSQVFSTQFPLGGFFTVESKQAFSSRIRGRSKAGEAAAEEEGEEIYDVGDPGDTPVYRMGTMETRMGLGGFTLGGTLLLVNLEGAKKLTPGIHTGFLFSLTGSTLAGVDLEAKTYVGAEPGGMCVGECNSEEGYDGAVVLPDVNSFQQQSVALRGFDGPCGSTFDVDFLFARPQSFSVTLSGSKELDWKGWGLSFSSSTKLSPNSWGGLGTTKIELSGDLGLGAPRVPEEEHLSLPISVQFQDGNGDLRFESGSLGAEYSSELGDGDLGVTNQFLWDFSDQDFAYRLDVNYSMETWQLQFINIYSGNIFDADWYTNMLRLQTGIEPLGLDDFIFSIGFTEDGFLYSLRGTWLF